VPVVSESLPLVSVVVPTHNRPLPLNLCVAAIMEQTYAGDIECIVVFDQSEPHPIDVEVGENRSIRVLSNQRKPGLAGARNTGILAARGEFLAQCDDDDLWLPDKLKRQLALLEQDQATLLVGCHIILDGATTSTVRAEQPHHVELADLLRARVSALHPSTLVARRAAVIDHIGLLDEELPGSYAEDYDWLLRAARHTAIELVPDSLVRVTWQTGSLFANRWHVIIEALEYLLDKHPEFATSPAGSARIEGQIAFAHAALGQRRVSARWARRALRHDPRQMRAYLALAVDTRLVGTQRILDALHRRGKGI
jgi:glycosyltransferase involved in cell wall biosynthesis